LASRFISFTENNFMNATLPRPSQKFTQTPTYRVTRVMAQSTTAAGSNVRTIVRPGAIRAVRHITRGSAQ
jgi:hypothetical protein